MNMEKYDVRELVEKIYELDVKVYEATGSTMGKVFPAGKDLSVKKMLKHLEECKKELEELNKMLAQYNPTRQLPDSFVSNISEMKDRFKDGNHRILCIGRQYGSGGHEVGMRLSTRLKMIEEMAKKGDCIFLGRCADVVLEHADIPHISVFIGAPFEERVKHDMACTGASYDDTVEKVRNMDRARKAYYNYYTGRHWGHSENYDMCLNTACYGIEGTVEVIEKMFNMFN